MAVSAERRKQIQAEILELITKQGGAKRGDAVALVERYPDVPQSTLMRWHKKILNESGLSRQQNARESVRQAKAGAKNGRRRKPERRVTLRDAKKVLPEPVSPETINPLAARSAIDQVRICIQHGENVLKYCTLPDGKIRNPKMYLQASNHIRASVESLGKISERLNDAQRIEQVHAAIFDEIRKCDPETAERILHRLQHLQELWGLR